MFAWIRKLIHKNDVHGVVDPFHKLVRSDFQKTRQPIRDPEKFNNLVADFHRHMSSHLLAAARMKDSVTDQIQTGSKLIVITDKHLAHAAKALDVADELIRMEPHRAIPWTNRVLALGALTRFDEALVANEQSIEIDPSDPDKWRLRANILRSLKRHDEAGNADKTADKLQREMLRARER